MENNKNYMKGFVPYAVAAAILSLCGGFTASVPTAISTAWNADASLTFITLAYSLAYNGAYIFAEGVITVIVLIIPAVSKALTQVKMQANE